MMEICLQPGPGKPTVSLPEYIPNTSLPAFPEAPSNLQFINVSFMHKFEASGEAKNTIADALFRVLMSVSERSCPLTDPSIQTFCAPYNSMRDVAFPLMVVSFFDGLILIFFGSFLLLKLRINNGNFSCAP